ncbi:MFS transporter [Ectobacillus antri]|uniref:MFS transporter n=1 Tax=Ectobacillus antri TaxID=2486280 RepID=A0ABT6H8C3_9BACI|nr:MFS transporter [Ectobacillus antri]MDG4658575.1 MFS transporter [Ectobacillus antri]MDG5755579.1 MFS transporter [Ectobacillus antri]
MNLKQLPFQVYFLAMLNLLYSLGVYVTLPVLALYFYKDLEVPIGFVGVLLGLPSIISAIFGSFGAFVSNRIGEINCMMVGITCTIFCYLFYLTTDNFIFLFIISVLSGLSRILWQPILKALFAHHASKLEKQDVVFRINYIVICIGAIVGPGISMLLNSYSREINIIISIVCFVLIVAFLFAKGSKLDVHKSLLSKKPNDQTYKRHRVDPLLLNYVIAGALVFMVFSQFETIFSLTLNEVSDNPAFLFSLLLILNSVSGIILQLVLIKFNEKMSTKTVLIIGNFGFALAYLLFAFSNGSLVLLVIATLLYSFGEVLAIPGSDIIINEIASSENKTLYFSIAEFRIIGFSLGPMLSGVILDVYGSYMMFLSSVVIILIASAIYLLPSLFSQNMKSSTNQVKY